MCWLMLYLKFKDKFDILKESTIGHARQYGWSANLINVVVIEISYVEVTKGSCANML